MADAKVSALTAETGISSDDVLYVVSAGTTSKKITNITIADGASVSGTNTGDKDVVADTTPQLGGDLDTNGKNITLSELSLIELDPAGSADEKYCGITVAGVAGATLAVGDLVYLAAADGRWELTDANAAATAGDVPLGIVVLAAASDGDATKLLLIGTVRSAAFPASIAVGAPVYVSTTAGDVQAAQPTGENDVIRRVGWAISAEPNTFYFCPSNDYITHVA